MEKINQIDQIIAVGSVDGILTTAALLRLIGNKEVEICFTQAFTVDKLPVGEWNGRKVMLVDLAVNNRDQEMTARFIASLRENDNKLVGVIDEHNREDWLAVLGSFDDLVVEPQSQNEDERFGSSGAVLSEALTKMGVACDFHVSALLEAADQADRGNFDTHFGKIANEAVKSNIRDDARRVHIARHLAKSLDSSSEMLGWIEEYKVILDNHEEILEDADDLGDGIFRASVRGKTVDITLLMFAFYERDARVIALQSDAFVPAEKQKREILAIGTNDKSLDLMATIREAGVNPLGGFAQKVNVDLGDEQAALTAVRAALTA